jgi:hypothetical protein
MGVKAEQSDSTPSRLPSQTPLALVNSIPAEWCRILASRCNVRTVGDAREFAAEYQCRTLNESYALLLWNASYRQLDWYECLTFRNRLLTGLRIGPDYTHGRNTTEAVQ